MSPEKLEEIRQRMERDADLPDGLPGVDYFAHAESVVDRRLLLEEVDRLKLSIQEGERAMRALRHEAEWLSRQACKTGGKTVQYPEGHPVRAAFEAADAFLLSTDGAVLPSSDHH
jgi:hypothetical protein